MSLSKTLYPLFWFNPGGDTEMSRDDWKIGGWDVKEFIVANSKYHDQTAPTAPV